MSEPAQPRVRVLVVDDERPIRRFLRTALAAHGYAVSEAEGGRTAVSAVAMERPDVVILDLGLPDVDGIEVTHQLREWTRVPIIILSVRGSEGDKVAALDAGADDYVTKPFGLGELLARLRVALRHAVTLAGEPVFRSGELSVDLARRQVSRAGCALRLTPTEYDLLRVLVSHAGKVLTHRQLLQEVWGPQHEHRSQLLHRLRVNMSNLRGKIESDPTRPYYLITEPGVGYRLRDEE